MVPTSTYQAYNNYYAKSLYSGASDPPNTVSGAPRAVTVSFDRPYAQPSTPSSYRRDWYTRTDVATVSWLEQQGYDVSYFASEDLHANGARAQNHEVLISGAHDEYWSQEMFDAAIAARDAGTSLVLHRRQQRLLEDPLRRRAPERRRQPHGRRLQDDRERPRGPERQPHHHLARPGRPEPARERAPRPDVRGREHRRTSSRCASPPPRASTGSGATRRVADAAGGGTATIGTGLIGWEWDSRVENGREPAGVQTIASSPVSRQPDPGQRGVPERGQRHRQHDCLQGGQRRDRLRHRHQQLVARPGPQRRRRGRARTPASSRRR